MCVLRQLLKQLLLPKRNEDEEDEAELRDPLPEKLRKAVVSLVICAAKVILEMYMALL